MHYFTADELGQLRINWDPKEFDPWAIKPDGRGVIAFTKTKDKTETVALFCRDDRVPRLFIKSARADLSWYQQALTDVGGMTAFGITIPKSAIDLKSLHGKPTLELAIPSFNAGQLRGRKSIGTEVDGPLAIWRGFSFNLPMENAYSTMSVALRNCI